MDFHITIGTYPSRNLRLDQELQLLKAAILYGDRVKMYSLQASMISMAAAAGDIPPEQQLKLIEMVAPYLTSQERSQELLSGLAAYRRVVQRRHLGQRELILKKRSERQLNDQWESVREVAHRIANEAGAASLARAVEAGLLDLHTFEGTNSDRVVAEFIAECVIGASQSGQSNVHSKPMSKQNERMIAEFVKGICDAVSDGSTHPLFDEQTGLLVKEQVEEQAITPSESAIGRGRQAGLAGHLLAKLPSFDKASIDEIIDIRKELEAPLIRFRGALIKFSEHIASSPWDEDFASDAETVFHREVAPAIVDIEEAVKSNRYIASLLRKLVDKPLALPAGSAVALALSTVKSLPREIALSIGAGVSALSVVYDAYEEWRTMNQEVERNAMFFYYRVGKGIPRQ